MSVHLDGRYSFILGLDDISDEYIELLIRDLGKHITFETVNRLSNKVLFIINKMSSTSKERSPK